MKLRKGLLFIKKHQNCNVAHETATLHFRVQRCSFLLLFLLLCITVNAQEGKLINPITDICWNCVFPIHVAGVNTTPGNHDQGRYKEKLCFCAGFPPKAGIPVAFWEPTHMIDVTRIPYKLLGFGGTSIGKPDIKKRGAISNVGESGRSSFYNVHYYAWPFLHWMGLLGDFPCLENSSLEVSYMSEFDPFWDDEEWSSVINPEAILFANPLAQIACAADCIAASAKGPLDELFWCAGCSGSLYPFTGHVAHHVGATQASFLLVERMLAKLHSLGLGWGFQEGNYCEKSPFPRLKKSIYKTQLAFPVAATRAPCPPLGQSPIHWGAGKTFPYKGEDFVYVIWTKKQCCLDAVQASSH